MIRVRTKNGRGKDTIDVPFDTKRILQHFDSAHKVEFDIFERPPLSFQKRNPSLRGGVEIEYQASVQRPMRVVGRVRTRISARSISHSLRSRSYLRHSV